MPNNSIHIPSGAEKPYTSDIQPLDISNSRAYLIGVADYSYTPWQLKTPVNDANKIEKLLREQHGFKTAALHNPTLLEMQAFFEKIKAENTNPQGRTLIYYAGHGVQRDSAYGLKGFFLPADAKPSEEETMAPMEWLSDTLRQISSRHVLLILDCCFAGSFRAPGQRSYGFQESKSPLRRQHYDIFCNFSSRLVMTSTSYRQKAFDRIEDDDSNSPFNRYLCQAIEGAADYTRDGLVTATELKTYLSDSVSKITQFAGNLQSVGLEGLEGDGEGEFLFFLNGFNASKLPEQAYINPYKGLQSYEPADVALFFGRQKATQALLEKARISNFTIVVGASGTGKSSLVKAGLLPRLPDQRTAITRPGKSPLTALPNAQDWDLLVIDQWEEVITQASDSLEIEQFYTELRRLVDSGKRIVGTVRADFEAQTRHDSLEPYWTKGRFVVPPFTSEEYHDVIVQPAKRVACLFEDRDLVQQIEQEVAQQPGPLPLLSFMLSELFERAKGESVKYREIKRRHYEAVGGVSGALRNKAEEVFAAMPDEAHRDTMRRLMLRMVALSAGEMAGRRVFLTELIYNVEVENQRIALVIQHLDEAKLIRRDADDAGRRFIEPAHDALVRAWKRLWDWVRELGEENLLLHTKLVIAVGDYQIQQSNKAFLWTSDPRLEQTQQLLTNEPLLYNAAERGFVGNSVTEKKRRARRNRIIAVTVGVAILAAAVVAWVQRNAAQQNLDNFMKANAERVEQEKQKERGHFDKFVRDGDMFVQSEDFDLALRKYHNADSLFKKYLTRSTDSLMISEVLKQKIGVCALKIEQKNR